MNKIGWCDQTINPITGCLNGCEYCYARKMAYRLKGRFGYPEDTPFEPTFHPDKLRDIENLKGKDKRVFLNSMSDWFSKGVHRDWISEICYRVDLNHDHTFLVLTKRPDRIRPLMGDHWQIPKNLWIGVTVTCQDDLWRVSRLKEALDQRDMRFVSIEPLHGFIDYEFKGIDWLIIGAESGNRKGKIVPESSWVDHLICINRHLPIFMKDNLKDDRRREFPWGI